MNLAPKFKILNFPPGLFHRAISMSGTVLNNWAFMKHPKEQSQYFGEHVGCPTKNSKEMVECLKKKDGRELAGFFKQARVNFSKKHFYCLRIPLSH